MKNIKWRQVFTLQSMLYKILGVASTLFALKSFLLPNNFLDGGVTGICILLQQVTTVNINILIMLVNLPFIYVGYKKIGKTFALQSMVAITLLTVSAYYINFPIITQDKILIAIFGGFFIGLGFGLVIRAGGVLDGMEVIADYTNKKYGLSTSEIILFINSLLMIVAAIYFGPESAMYSILTFFTAAKTSDYVANGFEEFTALTIVSKEHELIKSIIVNDFQKAITVYKGTKGFLPGSFDVSEDCDIVMTIVTRLELQRIKEAISEADPASFFFIHSIKEVEGGIVKQVKKH